jgi:hypothetical protein
MPILNVQELGRKKMEDDVPEATKITTITRNCGLSTKITFRTQEFLENGRSFESKKNPNVQTRMGW